MEYTQWVSSEEPYRFGECLNPCCNGIYSMSLETLLRKMRKGIVLILVVMEYTQWAEVNRRSKQPTQCLNPCCNGIYSMSTLQS